MDLFDNQFRLAPHKNPILSALIAFIVSLISFLFIGPLIGSFLAFTAFDGSILEFFENLTHAAESEKYKIPLFILQGSASFIGLFILPALYLKVAEQINPTTLFRKNTHIWAWTLAGLITLTFMPTNSIIIEWNANINFPEFMSGFEAWARETEDAAARMTEMLTQFDSVGEFLLGFLVIAVFAALGEELVFRGMIQNMLHRGLGNIHVAIWLSAFLFSLIHMQFFGFVPRLLLGGLFGYVYYWSGNLWLPIFSHMVNNGFMLVLIYLNSMNVLEFDLENSGAAPWYAVLLFAIITAGLIFIYRKNFIKYRSVND